MELEEMRTAWIEMSGEIDKQKKLTDRLIIDMTQAKYQHTLSKVRTPELISSVVCAGLVVLIATNFKKYDTGYLVACAIFSIAYLTVMPALSILAIFKISNLNIHNNNFKQTLVDYANNRINFLTIQKISFYLGFILMITSLPVMVKIIGGKNSQVESSIWFWFLPIGFLIYIGFASWVYRYYAKNTVRAENLLRELNDSY